MSKVCVMGLGYIGLPTASFLGSKGYEVVGVDVSPEIVQTINDGRIHITEPDLDVLVKSAVQSGNLRAQTEPEEADYFIIAVPTPLAADKLPDLGAIQAATEAIAPYIRPGNLVILESTCPVGTTEGLVADALRMHGLSVGDEVRVAHCPERVLPGQILAELVNNDRVVGGIDKDSTAAATEFYREFIRGEVIETTAATAELCKLAENTFRDVNIALANELSMICEDLGVDVWELVRIANCHPRVNILKPGPGVGGHCLAVDPWFIVAASPDRANLIRTARETNEAKPQWVIERVQGHAQRFKDPKIACLGLTYKADVDDLRESPAVTVVDGLIDAEIGTVTVCEPNIATHPRYTLVDLTSALAECDILVVLVDHRQFRAIKPRDLQEKIVVDTKGII